jgi:tetratricopeptide (TPR) repeat protein
MPDNAGKSAAGSGSSDAQGWFQRGVNALQRGELDEAAHSLDTALAFAPDQPAVLLAQAALLAARGHHHDAVRAVRELLGARHDFLPAQRQLAEWLRDTDAAQAGQWFTRCARAEPADAAAIGGALLMAARLQRRGEVAPAASTDPAFGKQPGLISVVMCSIDPEKLARARASLTIALADSPWELIHIEDARSLCEGYTRGLQRSRGELVVFCHDDIVLAGAGWATRLVAALEQDDVIGVAGTTRLTGANWAWAGAPHAHGWVAQWRDGRVLAGAYALDGPRIGAIQALDGVFIATRREHALQIGFDAQNYDGFHLYDTDFSWRAQRAGLRVAVRTDLPLVHWSQGRFNADWVRYARRFLAQAGLPQTAMAPVPGAITPIDSIEALPAVHAWLAHWIRNA